ncbi:MAG TPA: hypothetical protein PLV68_13570, partial [Ilumatobacteraceae bacterium]|nr:hypothetical protein [Ilumatobacteraceae bacterium]
DDVDVWSSFTGESPVWQDDDSPDPSAGYESVAPHVRKGQMDVSGQHAAYYDDPDPSSPSGAIRRDAPGRI